MTRNGEIAAGGKVGRSQPDEKRFAERLCRWFDQHARDLPWRTRRNGYSALVSESMLQQTQVARVIETYTAFMRRFPTIRDLAAADGQDVLMMWKGMGYYRRAASLHAAARMVVEEFEGIVPTKVEDLKRLPGVGRYTAGAIASIIHGRAEPIVDGNVSRVLARWHAMRRPMGEKQSADWVWSRASSFVAAATRPGVFNEAMMELGATICTPKSPRCEACPVAEGCLARRKGLVEAIPAPKGRANQRNLVHHAVVISDSRGRVLLEQRPPHGMWAGMWQVCTVESDRTLSDEELSKAIGIRLARLSRQSDFVHQTTHRRIRFEVYTARSQSRKGAWRDPDELDNVPMSNAQRRVLGLAGVAPEKAATQRVARIRRKRA